MMKPTIRPILFRVVMVSLSAVSLMGNHTIRIQNAGDADITLLIDSGLDDTHPLNDQKHSTVGGEAVVSADGRGEIVMFPSSPLLAPRIVEIPDWAVVPEPLSTTANSLVGLPLRIHVLVDYTAEDVAMTWPEIREQLEYSALVAISMFQKERLGAIPTLDPSDIIDDHRAPDASDLQWFSCTYASSLEDHPEYRPDPRYVNVYVVRAIDGSSGQGHTCIDLPGVIAICYDGQSHLLAHELGHALGLSHATASMRRNNVMQQIARSRSTMYAGQIFRAMFSTESILNSASFPCHLEFPYARECPLEERVPDVPSPSMKLH